MSKELANLLLSCIGVKRDLIMLVGIKEGVEKEAFGSYSCISWAGLFKGMEWKEMLSSDGRGKWLASCHGVCHWRVQIYLMEKKATEEE